MQAGAARAASVVELGKGEWTDERIIEGVGRGDPAAGRALYDRHGRLVHRMVWRLLGADLEHEDVVHQTFVNVLTCIGQVRNPASLGSWIAGVTVNTVRKELRSRGYRRILELVDEERGVSAGADPAVRSLYAAMGRLATDDRIAFTLHHVEGQSLPEVAAMTGCSLATVKRRIARARERLAHDIEKDSRLAASVEELSHAR